jgi:hypothetical protein
VESITRWACGEKDKILAPLGVTQVLAQVPDTYKMAPGNRVLTVGLRSQDREEDGMRAQYFFAATVVTLLIALAPRVAFAQGQTIKPSKNLISGIVDGEEVEKLRPPNGFITKKEDFDKLWKAWLLDENVPKVDFTSDLVVVATSREGPIKEVVLIDEKQAGDMKIKVELERKGKGTALQVLIAVFPRAGIKTINGKAIADK